jgi:hypothetical protein
MDDLIEKVLVRFPKAKRIAVENFTMGYDNLSDEALANLELDSRLYNWDRDTINAIISVISSKERSK